MPVRVNCGMRFENFEKKWLDERGYDIAHYSAWIILVANDMSIEFLTTGYTLDKRRKIVHLYMHKVYLGYIKPEYFCTYDDWENAIDEKRMIKIDTKEAKMSANEFRKRFEEARKKTGWVQIIDREGRAIYVAKKYTIPTQLEYGGRPINIYRPDLRHEQAYLGRINLNTVGDVKPFYNRDLIKSKPGYDSDEEWLQWYYAQNKK